MALDSLDHHCIGFTALEGWGGGCRGGLFYTSGSHGLIERVESSIINASEDSYTIAVPIQLHLCLDKDDNPHMIYYHGEESGVMILWYAHKTEKGWTKVIVDKVPKGSGPYGPSCSLALDTNGQPHIVFGGDGVFYAYRREESWIKETLTHTPCAGCGIAIDSEGDPHLLYALYDPENRWDDWELRYAFRSGQTWSTESIPKAEEDQDYYQLCLAMDSRDNPHICYSGVQSLTDFLEYGARINGTWYVGRVGDERSAFCHLVIDRDDRPNIVFSYLRRLGHAVKDNGGWMVTMIEPEEGIEMFASPTVGIDSKERVQVCCVCHRGSHEGEIRYFVSEDD